MERQIWLVLEAGIEDREPVRVFGSEAAAQRHAEELQAKVPEHRQRYCHYEVDELELVEEGE